METQNTNIEFLISAFAYPYVSMNETFYLRKRDLKLIGIHIFDQFLAPECKNQFNSGLSKEEERDIKEAIIALEKNYDTHVFIPRLTKEQRLEIMSDFIDANTQYKEKLLMSKNALIESTVKYGAEFYKKGIKPGIEMEYLTHDIEDEKFKSNWTEFYRKKTQIIALDWLEKVKNSL